MVPKICSFEDCDKPRKASGHRLCAGHQKQRYSGKELRPLRIKPANISAVIEPNVDKSSGCWEWLRGKTSDGYARQRWEGKNWHAHRLSYVNSYGPIPAGMQIDHMCHNPGCVNPQHLRLATPKQNQENRQSTKAASGYRGVKKDTLGPNWSASVKHAGVRYARHGFPTAEAADAAAREMRLELFTHNIKDRMKEAAE